MGGLSQYRRSSRVYHSPGRRLRRRPRNPWNPVGRPRGFRNPVARPRQGRNPVGRPRLIPFGPAPVPKSSARTESPRRQHTTLTCTMLEPCHLEHVEGGSFSEAATRAPAFITPAGDPALSSQVGHLAATDMVKISCNSLYLQFNSSHDP